MTSNDQASPHGLLAAIQEAHEHIKSLLNGRLQQSGAFERLAKTAAGHEAALASSRRARKCARRAIGIGRGWDHMCEGFRDIDVHARLVQASACRERKRNQQPAIYHELPREISSS